MGGWEQAVIEGLTMAQVLLLFLPKSGGGDTIAPLISDGSGGSLENKKKLALRLL